MEPEPKEEILIVDEKDLFHHSLYEKKEIEGRQIFHFNSEAMITLEEGVTNLKTATDIRDNIRKDTSVKILFIKNVSCLTFVISRFTYRERHVISKEEAEEELLKIAKKFEKKRQVMWKIGRKFGKRYLRRILCINKAHLIILMSYFFISLEDSSRSVQTGLGFDISIITHIIILEVNYD